MVDSLRMRLTLYLQSLVIEHRKLLYVLFHSFLESATETITSPGVFKASVHPSKAKVGGLSHIQPPKTGCNSSKAAPTKLKVASKHIDGTYKSRQDPKHRRNASARDSAGDVEPGTTSHRGVEAG